MIQFIKYTINQLTRRGSSVGQSTGLISLGSAVRIRPSLPYNYIYFDINLTRLNKPMLGFFAEPKLVLLSNAKYVYMNIFLQLAEHLCKENQNSQRLQCFMDHQDKITLQKLYFYRTRLYDCLQCLPFSCTVSIRSLLFVHLFETNVYFTPRSL